jgi:hypothetical protein
METVFRRSEEVVNFLSIPAALKRVPVVAGIR